MGASAAQADGGVKKKHWSLFLITTGQKPNSRSPSAECSLRRALILFTEGSFMRRAVSLFTIAFAMVVSASGQEKKSERSKFEPRSEPGAGQRLLKRFEGDWDVTKTMYRQTGEPSRATGRCRQALIHDGRFLQSDFTFEQGGTKTTGLGIIGFEPESGTFTSFWTDSRQTRMSVRQSRDRFDGEQIVLYSKSLDPDGKETRRSKTVSRLEAGDRKLIHRQYNLGPDGQERLFMELTMTRRTGASASTK
jgi:hypothetical protein